MQSKILNSGARLLVHEMKGFEGVSFKLFVQVGSGNEKLENEYGISHLIEHMFFKGTKTRTSLDIVKEFDKYGIQSNAYTTKNSTCYFVYGTKNALEKGVELISDMLFNSTFDEEELKKEKQVVIEEINMYQDMPDALCEILLDSVFFDKTNYAHDIAGTQQTVTNISREQILNYIHKNYTPKNIILSFAGNISFEEAENLANTYFENNFTIKEDFEYNLKPSNYEIQKSQKILVKDTNQAQVRIAYPTCNSFNQKEYLLNRFVASMLGNGMSSRLFQEVREKLGLVYTVYADNSSYDLTGVFTIAFGASLKNVDLALKTIKKVIDEVVTVGFNMQELEQTKTVLISNLKLNSDSPSNMTSRMINYLVLYNKLISKDDYIKMLEDVTLFDVNNQVKKIFSNNYCITMVSPNNEINLIESFEN